MSIERAWRILEHVAAHGAPPEPVADSMMSPAQFPAAGFVSGEEIVGDEINAYAELVGWRCRFAPTLDYLHRPTWRIVYPRELSDELDPALVAELDSRERRGDAVGRLSRRD